MTNCLSPTINDFDTPAEAFSVYDLPEEDRRKGLFLLVFDQPPQLDMRNFFRPVASLEVQHGLVKADMLLASMAQMSNFAMEPLRVHAFFKKTDEGLKLDWEVFVQTKYRTLRHFIESREVGRSGTFRVFIAEDVPERGQISASSRTYRIADPANSDDGIRIIVPVDTQISQKLSVLDWVGVTGASQKAQTATLELEWVMENNEPTPTIKKFICWQFLGLGGEDSPASMVPDPSEQR